MPPNVVCSTYGHSFQYKVLTWQLNSNNHVIRNCRSLIQSTNIFFVQCSNSVKIQWIPCVFLRPEQRITWDEFNPRRNLQRKQLCKKTHYFLLDQLILKQFFKSWQKIISLSKTSTKNYGNTWPFNYIFFKRLLGVCEAKDLHSVVRQGSLATSKQWKPSELLIHI